MKYKLCRHAPGSVFATRRGETISVERFLSDAAALALLLPAQSHIVNLCKDRYRFTVGLAAALLRGQTTLLPPGEAPGIFAQLAHDYAKCIALTDETPPVLQIPSVVYPDLPFTPGAPVPEIPAAQEAVILFTSGSTGRPVPHARSWGALVGSARAAGRQMGIEHYPAAALLATVPHQHSYGLESIVMLALQHGLVLDAERPLLPADIAADLNRLPRPRLLVTTPVHIKALLAAGEDMPPVDLILSATAPLAPQTAKEAEKTFAAPLHEIYGCSEAGQLAMRRTALTATWRCFEEITLTQDARGTWAGGDLVQPKTLLSDVIELTAPGEFTLLGRIADMIDVAGKRSSLAHLTYHLNTVEGVIDGVFVMPEPDPKNETARPIAFAVAPGLTVREIMAALRQTLDPAFLPRPLYLVNALPRNAVGKLTRESLMQLAVKSGKP
jgi:acyl-coenzyme A synthetase/AMP-(fatty) acid ligase